MRDRTSVIIPVRNGARFIAEAIGSVLPQLSDDDEILVVDDASSDATRSVLGTIADRRMRVLAGTGQGVSSARNIGLAAMTGDYVAFLDHDDLWPPGRHAALRAALQADGALDCAVGRLRLRIESDAVMLPRLGDKDGKSTLDYSLCIALFRRRIIDTVGRFDEAMQFGEDTDFYLRLTESGCRWRCCDVDALIYRRHSTNATCNTAGAEDGLMHLIRRRRVRMSGRKVTS